MAAYFENLREKLSKKSILAPNGQCQFWTGSLTTSKKYGVVTFKELNTQKWKQMHAHRMAVVISEGSFAIDKNLDASHLCHNALCINRQHISLETHCVNNNRQSCVSLGVCQGHKNISRL